MVAAWVHEEMQGVDLGDKRLNERLVSVVDQLSGQPNHSIPAACGGYAEMMAAYRLFDNKKVHFENVLEPHIASTYRRIAEHPVVILPQDTTELDVTRPSQQVAGAGPLDEGARRGGFLHLLAAFTPEGTPLGTVAAEVWTREESEKRSQEDRKRDRKRTPIEQKESVRWLEMFREAVSVAEHHPKTHIVSVADSEADIYELLQEATEASARSSGQVSWIIRACQDRALEEGEEDEGYRHLRERVMASPVRFKQTIQVRGRDAKVSCQKRGRNQPRKSRIATVEVRAATVTLRPPWRPDRRLKSVTVNVVLVREVNAPAGEVPVEWILLTNLPIDTDEAVQTVIEYYCVRWMIEVFFRTLKTGCRVEKRRFETMERVFSCLAVYLIVTWRTLFVCHLGREFPDLDCEAVFEPEEWKPVYWVVRKEPPPATPPPLQEMVRMVAQLGGYVNRTRPDEPGPQTVWIGLQRTHDFAVAWTTFGPDSRKRELLV